MMGVATAREHDSDDHQSSFCWYCFLPPYSVVASNGNLPENDDSKYAISKESQQIYIYIYRSLTAAVTARVNIYIHILMKLDDQFVNLTHKKKSECVLKKNKNKQQHMLIEFKERETKEVEADRSKHRRAQLNLSRLSRAMFDSSGFLGMTKQNTRFSITIQNSIGCEMCTALLS